MSARLEQMHRGWWLISVLLLLAGLAYGQSEYAGAAMCQMCHEDTYLAFQSNPHWTLETDARRGWEVCELFVDPAHC